MLPPEPCAWGRGSHVGGTTCSLELSGAMPSPFQGGASPGLMCGMRMAAF